MAGGIQAFFGDDWEDAIDSLKSAPGALGGIMLSGLRQVRAVDVAAFGLVLAGWAWILGTYFDSGTDQQAWHVALGLLPLFLWLVAGAAGALIFEIGGLGPRTLAYWESYVLILVFALFGVVSLRVALSPDSRQVHRGSARQRP
ncbi:MAG TPA: hypothetical protein VNN10_15675 [Dehalococcoidia bacterium]|nr:hypothetical protein [Dehalococcoidia bacterium]